MTAPAIARRRQEDRSAATSGRLLAEARRLFAEHGFANTSTEAVIAAAGVTRGALYHHFANKHALFAAVVEELQAEIGTAIGEAATAARGDRWDVLLAGCEAFLRATREQEVRRILLLDAPAVLGAAAWNEGDERHAAHRLRAAFRALAGKRRLGGLDADMLTAMINGSLNEAAFQIARSTEPDAAIEQSIRVLRALVGGLR